MPKSPSLLLLSCLLLLAGCQSVEQLSIDYMLPADVSFPASLRRVAIVNNMPEVPDNKPILAKETKKDSYEMARKVDYYNGNAILATESLAASLAHENYFNEVVICDSALRAHDITPREGVLSQNEVNQLVHGLDVDFLIALENVQIRSVRKIKYIRDWGIHHGTADAKVYSTARVYLPNRNAPMVTINANDSIFWEEAGNGPYVQNKLINEEDLIKQASEFAGTIPVKKLLPYWKTANRYLFVGGSVNMRDAAVYAGKKQWDTAIELWKETYAAKKGKKKMQAAYNLAVGYEMLDSIATATDWALKAQAEARIVDGVDKKDPAAPGNKADFPYYVLTTLYATELEGRKEGLSRLNMQMQRFNDDF